MKKLLLVSTLLVMLFASCTKQTNDQFVPEIEAKGKKPGGSGVNSIPAPTGLTVERIGVGKDSISWNPVVGATSYWLYRDSVVLTIIQSTSFIDNYADKVYSYAVAAVVDSKLGTKSAYTNEFAPQPEVGATARGTSRNLFVHVAADSYWGSFDPNPIANYKGAAFEVGVEKLSMQGDYTKSCWMGIRGRALIDGVYRRIWAQWGWYSLDNRSVDQAFYVYDLDTRSQMSGLDIQNQVYIPLVAGIKTRFEIVNIEGTTRWQFKRNDQIVFDVDLYFSEGANFPVEIGSNNKIEVVTEARGGDDFNPQLHVYTVEYYKDLNWYKVPHAIVGLSVLSDPTGRADGWNITPIGQGEFYIGGNGTPVQFGAWIW